MGTCKHMKTVENIAKDINRQYNIQLDYEYIERIKRLICGSVCNGVCDSKNIVQRITNEPVIRATLVSWETES